MLDILPSIYGGYIISHDKNLNTFRWVISKKEEIINIQKNYFSNYIPKSKKLVRLSLIPEFYYLISLDYLYL